MCTMIVNKISIDGSGKGQEGWFQVHEASVSYDHPYHIPLEYALNIDFVNQDFGPGARVAIELSEKSARALVAAIQEVLERAEAGGHLD